MPKYIKTYGIYGLLEWHGILKVGGVDMKVSFTNGSTTAYGVSPATLITKDELTQFVIEHSDKFKKGVIKLISQKALPEAEAKAAVKPEAKPEVTAKVNENEAPTANADGTTAVNGEDGTKVITVSSKSDAVEYLKEHFKEKAYTSVKLRTKEAFENACKECGVRFVW